jgi:hypothetical protein
MGWSSNKKGPVKGLLIYDFRYFLINLQAFYI